MERSLSELKSVQKRLIPLTSEIKLALMEFKNATATSGNESPSSLTELVRREVEACVRVFDANIENCIKKEELSDIINQCIQEKFPTSNTNNYAGNQKDGMEVTIQFVDTEANKEQLVLKENFSILEQRISALESRMSSIFQMIPRLKKISAQFKIDRKTLRDSIERHLAEARAKSAVYEGEETDKSLTIKSLGYNPYDDMYYEWRQNRLNRLRYKPSECTLSLNKRLEAETFHGILPLFQNACMTTKPVTVQFITSPEVLRE